MTCAAYVVQFNDDESEGGVVTETGADVAAMISDLEEAVSIQIMLFDTEAEANAWVQDTIAENSIEDEEEDEDEVVE